MTAGAVENGVAVNRATSVAVGVLATGVIVAVLGLDKDVPVGSGVGTLVDVDTAGGAEAGSSVGTLVDVDTTGGSSVATLLATG